jgi:TPR repeat protein
MNDSVRAKLAELLRSHGRALAEDPRRVKALLRDTCPDCPREVHVLVSAAEQRVPADLLASEGVPWEVLSARLVRRLIDELALSEDAARWAVRTWADVLGRSPGARITDGPRQRPADRTAPAAPPRARSSRSWLWVGLVLVLAVGAGGAAFWRFGNPFDRRGGGPSPEDEAELRSDWEDYKRAAITTGSLPFFRERGPKRAEPWKRSAEGNNTRGMILYARCLQEGVGVTKDRAEAVRWFRKAAELDEPLAMANLGVCYMRGEGVTKDEPEAVRWYRKGAGLGEPLAMMLLAACCQSGTGVSEDRAEGVRWYRKAADLGAPRAMSRLADCYQNGRGVKKDPAKGVKWYRKAADLGEPSAMSSLAECYEYGTGVAKDRAEGIKWYRKAADANNVGSMLALAGRMTEGDDQVTRSPAEALAMLEKARDLDAANGGNQKYTILEALVRAGLRLAEDDLRATRLGEARTRLTAARKASEVLNKERPGRFYFMQDLGRIWFELGNVEKAEGNLKAAADCYRKSMAVDGPEMTKATVGLADLLENGGGWRRTCSHFFFHFALPLLEQDEGRLYRKLAEEIIAVDSLKKRVARAEAKLQESERRILTLRNALKSDSKRIFIKEREYDRADAEKALRREQDAYKSAQKAVKAQKSLLAAREKRLADLRERHKAMKDARRDLEVTLARLEAEIEAVRGQKPSKLTEGKLSAIKRDLRELKKRLEVEQKKIELKSRGTEIDTPQSRGDHHER